jgi:uncharacterized membrane protein YjjB (DUF3815 family)
VAGYCVRLGLPRRHVWSVAALGALTVVLEEGLTGATADFDRYARIALAALVIGTSGRLFARWTGARATIWQVPSILPAPATLLWLLADNDAMRQTLQGQARETAFLIGVGVASGDILTSSGERLLRPRKSPPPHI